MAASSPTEGINVILGGARGCRKGHCGNQRIGGASSGKEPIVGARESRSWRLWGVRRRGCCGRRGSYVLCQNVFDVARILRDVAGPNTEAAVLVDGLQPPFGIRQIVLPWSIPFRATSVAACKARVWSSSSVVGLSLIGCSPLCVLVERVRGSRGVYSRVAA